MSNTSVTVLAILASLFTQMQAIGLLGIALPLELAGQNTAVSQIGYVMAFYSLGTVLGSLYGKRVITQVGHIRTFAGFAALAAIMALLHQMMFDTLVWALLRLMYGFCAAIMLIVLQSWLSAEAPAGSRGRWLGFFQMVVVIAMGSGQLLINLSEAISQPAFILAAILCIFSLMPLTLFKTRDPIMTAVRPLGFLALCRLVPVSVLGAIGAGMAVGAYYNLAPLYTRAIGLDTYQTSLFMSALVFSGVLLQYPIGRLTDRYDRGKVLLAQYLAFFLLNLLLALLPTMTNLPLLLLASLCLGSLISSLYPTSIAAAYDRAGPELLLAITSGLLITYALGGFSAPVLASWAMEWLGAGGLFLFMALIEGLITLTIGIFLYRQARPSILKVSPEPD